MIKTLVLINILKLVRNLSDLLREINEMPVNNTGNLFTSNT